MYRIAAMTVRGLLLVCVAVLSACTTYTKPVVVVLAPPSGSQFYEGDEIAVQSTSADPQGVVRVELMVDGNVVRTDVSPVPQGQMNFTVVQVWKATAGTHVITVRAYNVAGVVSDPIGISVEVLPRAAQAPTLTPIVLPPSPTPLPPVTIPQVTPSPTVATPSPPPTETPTSSPPLPQAPAAPSNFSATGTGTTIRFVWTDNATNELGFRIYQVGVTAPVLTLGANAGTGETFYAWMERPCNLQASYYIRAYNAAGESAPSAAHSAVTIPCAPGGLSVAVVAQTTVTFSFTDNATNESEFRLYRTDATTPVAIFPAQTGTGTRTDTLGSLPCGTSSAYYVRAYNTAGESAASNTISVTTNPCTVNINFTTVLIHNDSDGDAPGCVLNCGPGEVWLELTVNGQNKRWPPTGQVSINTGETKPITDIAFTFSLLRTQNLTILVKGREEDTLSPDDDLGMVSVTYRGADNWGAGSRCTESTSPNYFRICYTITVTP